MDHASPAQVGCMRQALGPGAMGRPGGSGWRGRWERGSGWGRHVNSRPFHFNVWQNPLQKKKKRNGSCGLKSIRMLSLLQSNLVRNLNITKTNMYRFMSFPWPQQNGSVGPIRVIVTTFSSMVKTPEPFSQPPGINKSFSLTYQFLLLISVSMTWRRSKLSSLQRNITRA